MKKNSSLTLEVTNKCNYLCDNCYLSSGPYRNDYMSKAVIDKSFIELGYKVEKIIIDGGEPTLVLDTVKYIVDQYLIYKKKFGYLKKIVLRTNGAWGNDIKEAKNNLFKFYEIGITDIELCGVNIQSSDFFSIEKLENIKELAESLKLFGSVEIRDKESKKLGRAKKLNNLDLNKNCSINNGYKINVYGDIKICEVGHTCYMGSILEMRISDINQYEFINILINEGIEGLIAKFELKFNEKVNISKEDICEICHYITQKWKAELN